MQFQSERFARDEDAIVEEVIARVGNTINLATPLAIGKANHVINAFYRRARSDASINLAIMTALTLERPKGKSLLEQRFLDPFVERVIGDYPDLDCELDRVNNALPENVRIIEFYFPPGKFLNNPRAQQDYISSNYTHVVRDLMDRGANVIAQLISPPENADSTKISLSGNPDAALDLIKMMQQREQLEGVPFALVGQVNPNLPYMFGDAEIEADNFHYILDNPAYYFRIFGPPKLSVPLRDREELIYDSGVILTPDGLRIKADFSVEENRQRIFEYCLGDRLKRAAVVHGAFFMGPQDFYQALRSLPEHERRLFNMRSVRRINHLYGHEEIDRLQRKNARFINTCMKVTLSGQVVSDGLEDGRVISGVGGQYNFVAMAHELPDGRSLINLRATREEGGKVVSNIIWNYGHCTIPRHLRDIIVTEYGIADLRGKTDSEIIEALLNITDSRFQTQLMNQAKAAGKLRRDYRVPEQFRGNYPETITRALERFDRDQLFSLFPFGTDFTKEERVLGRALKSLKRKSQSRRLLFRMVIRAIFQGKVPDAQKPYLERMKLLEPRGLKERVLRGLLVNELKHEV